MCRSVDRFLGGALGVALLAALAAGPGRAGPVSSTAQPAQKIEEIQKATDALAKGQVDEAFKLLQEAVKKHPHLPPAKLILARLFLASTGNAQVQNQGRVYVEQAAVDFADNPEVYLTLGMLAINDNRRAEAILSFQKALELVGAERWTPEQKKKVQTDARIGLANAFESRGDWANARTHLAMLLELDPKNGKIRGRLATAMFFLGKHDEAFVELQQAHKDDPTNDSEYVTMGQLWAAKGDAPKAKEYFDKAVNADKTASKVRVAYAHFLITQDNIAAAKMHLETASKTRGDDTEVLNRLGLIARMEKDLGLAEKYFKQVIVLAPADFFASNQLALVLADKADADSRARAVQLAEVNYRQYQTLIEALATLGYANFRNGNTNVALQALTRAAAGGQISADTAYYLALALNDVNKADDAKKVLRGALDAKGGLFVYRKEAQTLYDKLPKGEAEKKQ